MEVNNRQAGGSEPAGRGRAGNAHNIGPNRAGARRGELHAQPASDLEPSHTSERDAVHQARSERAGRALLADVLQLSHANGIDEQSPAREARLKALTEAFREGKLNSAELIARAAEKLLRG